MGDTAVGVWMCDCVHVCANGWMWGNSVKRFEMPLVRKARYKCSSFTIYHGGVLRRRWALVRWYDLMILQQSDVLCDLCNKGLHSAMSHGNDRHRYLIKGALQCYVIMLGKKLLWSQDFYTASTLLSPLNRAAKYRQQKIPWYTLRYKPYWDKWHRI